MATKSTSKHPVNEKETAKQKAIAVLEAEQKKEIEAATFELNEFIQRWSEKHSCAIVCTGKFQGDMIQTAMQIIKTK